MIVSHCEHCGASLKKFWHKMTPGLVNTLVMVYKEVNEKGENRIHKNDLKLTHGEYGNFQKLRFHALIAKYKVNGEWRRGEWLLTRRGAEFLKGETTIPDRVQTFRNKVTAHGGEQVSIAQVIGEKPYFETDFAFEYADVEDLEKVPVVAKMKKTRKKQIVCPKCGDRIIKQMKTTPGTRENSVIVEYWYECLNKYCDFREDIA